MAEAYERMDTADRDALISAIERAFAEVEIDLYDGAAWLKRQFDDYYPILEASLSRSTLAAYFDSAGEEDAERAKGFIALCMAAPGILKQFAIESIGEAAESLPAPPLGRPHTLTSDQMRQINAKVASLILKGVQTGDAQDRAAQHFGISKRTVQRAWHKRQQLAEEPFQSIGDLVRFFGDNFPA